MMVSIKFYQYKFSFDSLFVGASYNGEKDAEISCKDDISTNYDRINRSAKVSLLIVYN
jgi:hypothetical protein